MEEIEFWKENDTLRRIWDPLHELPRWINPYEEDSYRYYYGSLHIFNESLQKTMSKFLGFMKYGFQEHYALTATGSDGRFEKGPQSKIEILMLKKEGSEFDEEIREFEDKLKHPPFAYFFDSLEVKNLDSHTLSYFRNDPKRVHPTRMFDMRFLGGNRALMEEAYNVLFREITEEEGARIRHYVRDSKDIAKKVMKRGKQSFGGETFTHYDLESGIAYYGPRENERGMFTSFKNGPLRYIQYEFADELIKYLRSTQDEGALHNLPKGTIERFLMLEPGVTTKLSPSEISDIVDNYAYFLHLLHMSEFKYRNGNGMTSFYVPEVKERINALESIMRNGVLKY
ncbi:MAG TPA: hypothetical protein VI564_05940 [Candidatus Nanoarchaeia archaeon]|nr:hypothetical protein [Candidatus Nanoarchaeia archaeon]